MHGFNDQRRKASEERNELFRRKLYSDASALELEYLASHPDDAGFHAKAARTFAALRDMGSALKHQKRVVEIEPLNANARSFLARLYQRTGDVAAATAQQRRAEKCAGISHRLFARRSSQRKAAHRDRLMRVLADVLPNWKHAHSTHPELRFGHLLDKYGVDDIPGWISHAPEPLAEGSIVSFDEIGSFRVGNAKEVVQKRLARNMPWELPIAILLMELVSRCDPNSLVLDIGANIGTLTVPMGRAFAGNVLAFEPLESNYRSLLRHLDMNGATNVTAVQKACGRAPGSGHMVLATDTNPGAAQLRLSNASGGGVTEVVTLDSAVSGATVGLVKMDIEGHESDAIAGAAATIARDRPLILCELLRAHSEALKDQLAALGYIGIHVFRSDWLFYRPSREREVPVHRDDGVRRSELVARRGGSVF